jgi:PAS domain S-box-containing protein
VFESLFERSADAIWLHEITGSGTAVLLDCNQAAADLIGAQSKEQLLGTRPEELSPPVQLDGTSSAEKSAEIMAAVLREKTHRFEWALRRLDGKVIPTEVSVTAVVMGGKRIHVAISREISERKKAERDLLELNQSLEQRVTERTTELSTSEARLRALVEHAPEAIVVFDGVTGRFLFGNKHACRLYGVAMEKLTHLTPSEVSPEFQPCGRRSSELAREKMDEALAGHMPIFEWVHQQPTGRLVPTEVRLLRLPSEGRNLIRASIIDSTERKIAERALRDSEAKYRALFESTSNGVVLMEPDKLLEVNPAAVRILRRRSADEMVGKHPSAFSPLLQPNGLSSEIMAQRYIEECIAKGSLRVEWMCSSPEGREIPLEVLLTRIEWSGRQVIQACITDITERKQAERALRESEEKFRALFEGSSQGVVLHDENQILEVNPAAVRIMGCESQQELLGKHPGDTSPPLQPNGESSALLARKHIEECMANGSARFDWISQTRQGRLIPLEVTLTRIEWSGRQVIQALVSDISERKKAESELRASEARLRESEARFSAAFRASALCMTISRMDDRKFVLANEAFLNWTGYRLDEVVGRSSEQLEMWPDPVERERFWEELRHTRSIHERECLMRNRDGKLFTMLVSCDAIEIEGATHLLTVGLDITERKRAQAALAESEARFSVAFQASPVFISIMRMSDEKYVLANDALLSWIGFPREQFLGRTSAEMEMWVEPSERRAAWRDLRTVGSIRQREVRWRNRGGQLFTILLSAETITVGNQQHVLSMALDISQRKQAEEELRASEARLRESETRFSLAFDASPMFITILRLDNGQYVWANDAFVNRLGYSREDVLGRTSPEFNLWVDPSERKWAWETMLTVGSVRQRECRWLTRSGEPVTILLSAEIIKFQNAPHVLSLALDITQRKHAEVELIKALEREKELSQLKSNFVSMVSHEFRTPLGIIQSSAELLRDFYQRMRQEEREEQLDSISANTRRMAGMMEEILVLSRLEAGKLQCNPASLDLTAFSRRIVDEVLSATNRRCPIELSLKSLLNGARADEGLLSHVFTNILSNAVKYSEPGGLVQFTLDRDGPELVGTVRDRGLGISEEDQEKLFTAFHRGTNVGARPGTGLGLVLVKRCADLHGGKVKITSKVGGGTTVVVRLPVFSNEKNIGN